MGLTIEQQRAIALAKARGRAKVRQTGGNENGYIPSNLGGVDTSILDRINTFGNGLVDQIPIVGPALSDFGAGVDAAWASMIEGRPVTKEERLRINKSQEEEFPLENVGGRVAGVVAPFMLAAPFAGASRVLGMSGSLGSQMGFGLGSGALISGADTAARGGDVGEVLASGAVGGVTGGVFPVLTRGAKLAFDALKGNPMVAKPVAKVADALTNRDKLTAAMVEQRLKEMGPGTVIGDMGENVRGQVGALATMPGEAKQIIADILNARHAGTNSRIVGDVDAALGPATTPNVFGQGIKEAKSALSPLYEKSLEGAKAVDTSAIALDLDSAIVNLRGEAQTRAKAIRDMLNVVGTNELDPNPRTLLNIRQAIDDMYAEGLGGNTKRLLSDIRGKVDAELASKAPGVKAVDEQFAALSKQQEAFDLGQTLLDSGRTSLRPADLAAATNAATPSVLSSLSAGARAEIDRLIGTTANDVNALKTALKGDGSWNRQKLAQLFGDEKADRLVQILDREVEFTKTFNAAFGNSKTAATTAAQKEFSPEVAGLPTSTTWTGLAASALTKGAGAAAGAAKTAGNSQAAKVLMSGNLPEALKIAMARAAMLAKPALIAPAAPAIGVTTEKKKPIEIVVTGGNPALSAPY